MNILGAGILFGGADVTATSLAGLCQLTLLQNLEVTEESDEDIVKDMNGDTATVAKFDSRRKMTLEFIPTSSSNTGTITVSSYPSVGGTITVTNTTFVPAGGAWIVDSINWTRTNTRALSARMSLSRYIGKSVPA